jgi:hypothetical protein
MADASVRILFALAVAVELVLTNAASRFGDFVKPGTVLVFVPMMLLAGSAFLAAVRWFSAVPEALHGRVLWGTAIAMRLAMLGCAPGDDFWRYAWEGRVQIGGENPYVLAPDAPELARLRNENWTRINHAEWPAVYPPGAELVFGTLTLVSSSPTWFKLAFIGADLLTLAMLRRLVNARAAAWYAWNPAVAYAFAGAAHYDSLMICAVTAAVVALDRGSCSDGCRRHHAFASAAALGIGIALKLVPLIFLPVWAFALRSRAWMLGISLAIPALLAIPFGGVATVLKPARDFGDITRFNELLVWIFPNPWQRNWPVMLLLAITIAAITIGFRNDWRRCAFWVLGAALILSPAMHPWYATWILPLAIWRGQPTWTVLSLSTIAALLLWDTTALWTAWHPNLLTRAMVIVPPLLAWWAGPGASSASSSSSSSSRS